MDQYLIDTDICINFLKGKFGIIDKVKEVGIENCYISEITIAELTFGAYKSTNFQKHILEVKKMEILFEIVPIYGSINKYGEERVRLDLLEDWIRREDGPRLTTAVKNFSRSISLSGHRPEDQLASGESWFVQASNGYSAQLIKNNPNYQYWVPTDKATLWLRLAAIPKKSQKKEAAHRFINHLLSSRAAYSFATEGRQATVVETLNDSPLNEMLKASFIRRVDISRLSLVTHHGAFQAIWQRILSNLMPLMFPPKNIKQISPTNSES